MTDFGAKNIRVCRIPPPRTRLTQDSGSTLACNTRSDAGQPTPTAGAGGSLKRPGGLRGFPAGSTPVRGVVAQGQDQRRDRLGRTRQPACAAQLERQGRGVPRNASAAARRLHRPQPRPATQAEGGGAVRPVRRGRFCRGLRRAELAGAVDRDRAEPGLHPAGRLPVRRSYRLPRAPVACHPRSADQGVESRGCSWDRHL